MPVRMKFWLAAALIGAAAAGCQAPPPEAYVAGPATTAAAAVPIGNNEAGEPCRYQLAAPAGDDATWRQKAAVYCGNWDQPSARVFELGEAADPARLGQVAVSGPWRTYVDQ